MTQDYPKPIAPPPELPMQFLGVPLIPPLDCTDPQSWIAERIYQMGADQELEACCEWLRDFPHFIGIEEQLRAARRPKPPNLKEQAIAVLEDAELNAAHYNILLRALEQLND
jgi:hypothetical protein